MLCLVVFLICDLCVKNEKISGMKFHLKEGLVEKV